MDNVDDNIEKDDIRTRKFGDVTLPPKQEKLTNRSAPSPERLGPLEPLLGVWTGKGTGWNMIALPFHDPSTPFLFRLLMNQYDEELIFTFVDDDVPNRGLRRPDVPAGDGPDQFVVTLDYQQKIVQRVAEDRPDSGGLAGKKGLPIHHEPGLWLYDTNRRAKDDQIIGDDVTEVELDVARLASIPHGNSLLALGKSAYHRGMPKIPPLSGLPTGRFENVLTPAYDFKSDPYLEPYKHYIDFPFMGNQVPPFPGFSPADMNQILRFANQNVDIVRTTTLTVDTTRKKAGIRNAPFSVREAEPVSMKSTFWIQELAEKDVNGNPRMRLQYSQVVMLNFFHPRQDEFPERFQWPHISIATLEKTPFRYELVSS